MGLKVTPDWSWGGAGVPRVQIMKSEFDRPADRGDRAAILVKNLRKNIVPNPSLSYRDFVDRNNMFEILKSYENQQIEGRQ